MRGIEHTLRRLEPRSVEQHRERASHPSRALAKTPVCHEAATPVATRERQRDDKGDGKDAREPRSSSNHDLGHTDALGQAEPPAALIADPVPDRQTKRELPRGVRSGR